MCRWMGYFGAPVRPELLLYETEHSLIVQSRRSVQMVNAINGDGFGLGWYGIREEPGVYRNPDPAWSDRNLRVIAGQVESPLFLAHVRASTGTPSQQTNCHPFQHGEWIFVHNGFINEFHQIRRELLLAVDPELFDNIEGTTDSEVLFHLALTFGLRDDPIGALEQMAGFVEHVCGAHGIGTPLQMTIGVSNGKGLWAARYASQMKANTLYVSAEPHTIREMYPDRERLAHLADDTRIVVSEPLVDLPGVWHEMEAGSAVEISAGTFERRAFAPRVPAAAT